MVEDDGLVREDVALVPPTGVDRAVYRYRSGLAAVDPGGRLPSSSLSDINLADAITGWDVAEAGRYRIKTLRSFMPQDGRRVRPASCLGVFFSPSLCRRKISCLPVRDLCRSPDKHVFKNRLT